MLPLVLSQASAAKSKAGAPSLGPAPNAQVKGTAQSSKEAFDEEGELQKVQERINKAAPRC